MGEDGVFIACCLVAESEDGVFITFCVTAVSEDGVFIACCVAKCVVEVALFMLIISYTSAFSRML